MVGVGAAYITSGAAAGITLATATCITWKDPEKMKHLPNTEEMKNEVIMLKGQVTPYYSQFEAEGAKLVLVVEGHILIPGERWPRALGVSPESVEAAINERTYAIAYTWV